MSNYVLGLHGVSAHSKRLLHDTGASLVSNGKIIASINEERLSRKKNDGLFPWRAYKKIMKEYNLSSKEISAVAFPDKKALWQTYHILKYAFKTYQETGIKLSKYVQASFKRALDYKRLPPNSLKKLPIYFIEHHLCHAASAYYTSPWDDVAIVTLDGMGDWCIGGTINIGQNGKIKTLRKTNGFYSPGFFYMFITSLLGYIPGRHEGKIMGLAAYGNADLCYPILSKLIQYQQKKHDFYSWLIPYELGKTRYIDGDMQSDFKFLKKKIGHFSARDIAAATQKRLEEVVVDYIKDAIELTKKRKIVVAGGVFANVKLNEKILSIKEVDGFYVHPNMGDGGLATGAALYAFHHHIKLKEKSYRPVFMKTAYLGPSYSLLEIEKTLQSKKMNYKKVDNVEKKNRSSNS